MDYLIFKTLSLAVSASFLIWYAMRRINKDLKENLANPVELETGEYGIKKPEDRYILGIDAPIEIDPPLKNKP